MHGDDCHVIVTGTGEHVRTVHAVDCDCDVDSRSSAPPHPQGTTVNADQATRDGCPHCYVDSDAVATTATHHDRWRPTPRRQCGCPKWTNDGTERADHDRDCALSTATAITRDMRADGVASPGTAVMFLATALIATTCVAAGGRAGLAPLPELLVAGDAAGDVPSMLGGAFAATHAVGAWCAYQQMLTAISAGAAAGMSEFFGSRRHAARMLRLAVRCSFTSAAVYMLWYVASVLPAATQVLVG